MKPYFKHNGLNIPWEQIPDVEFLSIFKDVNCGFDFEETPRVYAGFVNECGLGARIRYWQFDHGISSSRDVVEFNPDIFGVSLFLDGVLGASRELEMHTLDIEATQDLHWCQTDITFGAGARYLRIKQEAGLSFDGFFAFANEMSVEFEGYAEAFLLHELEGGGPTFSVNVRRRIGCSSFFITGGLRESVLFVSSHRGVGIAWEEADGTAPPIQLQDGEVGGGEISWNGCDSVLAVTEISLGLEVECCFGCSTLVGRFGYEGQIYHDSDRLGIFAGDLGIHGLTVGGGIIL